MATYQRLPTSPQDARDEQQQPERELSRENPLSEATIAEFNRPEPAWWKRAGLLVLILFLSWLAIKLGGIGGKKQPEVIYATRYSDEFKYRPAASPIITEHLKDGRIRIRGATPGGVGVRAEDMPKTPEQRAYELRVKKEEALEAAKQKFKDGKAKRGGGGKGGKGKRKRTGRGSEP
ncbi:hypothetical protein Q8F55_000442 [Vanrija albida]|uniref:Uncharacterized protein n=1 Tax=Vanrija albida TaxID=181172 RepID=A0ABR3QDA0_9TREE